MAKKKFIEFSEVEVRARMKDGSIPKAKQIKDEDIDFSDMPELTPERMKTLVRVRPGRPVKGDSPRVSVHFRLEKEVLKELKKKAKAQGVPYQSLMNDILKKAV